MPFYGILWKIKTNIVRIFAHRADNPLAHATVHKSAKIFKLLDALNVKNMEQFCRNLDALTPQQRAHLLGTMMADTVTLMGIARIPGTVRNVFHGVSNISSESVIGRSLQQATTSVNQKVTRLRSVAHELGLTHAPETVAIAAEGIEAPVTTAAARETMLAQEANESIRGARENARKAIQMCADVESCLTKNKNTLESFDRNINDIAKTAKPGKVGKVLEKTHAHKLPALELETKTFYENMRKSALDIEKICQNTGLDRNIITRIKNHLFNEEHILRTGISKFHPDEDIAAAWQRLIDNNYVYSDLKLLQHEYAESLIMNGLEMTYDDVHPRINTIYNWEKSL